MKTTLATARLNLWLLALLWIATAGADRLAAATNVVLAGEDLQAKINAAASGDVMVVQSGTYGGELTINKPLAFVRSGSADLQILGPVTIATAGTVSFHQYQFSDRVFVAGNTELTLVGSLLQGSLGITDASCTLRQSSVKSAAQYGIQLTNANLTMLRSTNGTTLFAIAPTNGNRSIFMTQSGNGNLEATGYRVHCGYSSLAKIAVSQSTAVIVGNLVVCNGYGSSIDAKLSTVTVRNNYLRNGAAQNVPGEVYGWISNISVEDSVAVIENNTLIATRTYGAWPHPKTIGIKFTGDSSKVDIISNIIRLNDAPLDTIRREGNPPYNIAFNFVSTPSLLVNNGTAYAMSNADPKLNEDGTLAIDSPCRNAGPPEAIYNDRDGTRNDVGFTGGPLYNPAHFTTDLPLAFWLNTSPRKVLKGVNNTIRVDAAAAAGH
jgi:hypothetical protein